MNKKLSSLLIVAGLVLLFVFTIYGKEKKNTPESRSWEYKSILIARQAASNAEWSKWIEVSGEVITSLPLPVSMPKKENELGSQGWELVAVTPISSNAGGSGTSGYNNLAGFTSQILYVFKRPK